jgi:plasmid stability protein
LLEEIAMASLHVRNVEDDIVKRLKERAAHHGRSAEAEHREILRHVLARGNDLPWEERAARLRERLEGRVHTPSEILIREDRDSR